MRKSLFLPLLASVIIFSCFSVLFAQNSTEKNSDEKDKQEKIELERFFSEFVKDFEIHKDLDQVSPEFFAPEFKKVFAQNDTWIKGIIRKEISDQLTETERYQHNISINNLMLLWMMTASHKMEGVDDSDWKNEDFKKLLLPSTIEIIEQSKWFNIILDKTDERQNPKTKEEWRSYINEANSISDAWRKELDNPTEKEKLNYKRNYTEFHNQTESFEDYSCKNEDCFGLPENTRIYGMGFFITVASVAKINGQFKIVNFHFAIAIN